jgi:hypothetical protein
MMSAYLAVMAWRLSFMVGSGASSRVRSVRFALGMVDFLVAVRCGCGRRPGAAGDHDGSGPWPGRA